MKKFEIINNILEKELIKSMGCTEPSSIAFAVSYAKEKIPSDEKIHKIELYASSNILKNALCVTLPNTKTSGILTIIILALIKCKSKDKLTILNNITLDDIKNADKLKNEFDIIVKLKENVNPLYIEVHLESDNHKVITIVQQEHDKINYCSVDNKIIFQKDCENKIDNRYTFLTFDDIFSFVQSKMYNSHLLDNVKKYNYEIGQFGLENNVGLNVGSILQCTNIYSEEIQNVIATTCAGIDSRMSGVPKKVIINSGSGNQGITATIPIVEFAKQFKISPEIEMDALALSHLITIYIRSKQNRLSSSCGAICASAGVAAGISYMLGCNKEQIEGAIKNLLCSSFGVFCDGAKATCSLKVASAISSAINSAYMASKGIVIRNSYGVISPSLDGTLLSLGKIENEMTEILDKTIMNEVIKNNSR